MTQIALVIGSLSQQSLNRKIAQFLVANLPAEYQINEVQIGDLPLYTQDLDSQSIPAYDRVREQLKHADAVLMVSPEHNRSVPAALKNLIDVATRPMGQNVWTGKKVAVVTASPGAYGGINAGLDLRKILHATGANVLANEVYLSQAHTALNEQGEVTNERTAQFLTKFALAFSAWVNAYPLDFTK